MKNHPCFDIATMKQISLYDNHVKIHKNHFENDIMTPLLVSFIISTTTPAEHRDICRLELLFLETEHKFKAPV